MEHAELAAARLALEGELESACLVSADGVILHCNRAWDDFARANGGAPRALGAALVGRAWLSGLAGEDVVRCFREVLRRALAGQALSVPGECNTPEVARAIVSRFQPIHAQGRGAVLGVAAVCSVVRAVPVAERHDPLRADDGLYRDGGGIVHMCACCRRVRRLEPPERWDFVPGYLRPRDLTVSHGFCQTCYALQFSLQ